MLVTTWEAGGMPPPRSDVCLSVSSPEPGLRGGQGRGLGPHGPESPTGSAAP